MKYIILFLISFNVFSQQVEIKVFDENDNLIAGDRGNTSRALLAQKMQRKGINILDPKFRIEERNIDAELAQEETAKQEAKTERRNIQKEIKDFSGNPRLKKILLRIVKDLYSQR